MTPEQVSPKTRNSPKAKVVLKESTPASIFEKIINNKNVFERLFEAIDSGTILVTDDGHITTPSQGKKGVSSWISVSPSKYDDPRKHYKSCQFLLKIVHDIIYDKSQVPQSCQKCYKVKVEVENVYALKQLYELSQEIPWISKFGTEIDNPYSQSIYSGFFYVDGLKQAHEAYHLLNEIISQHDDLMDCSKVTIKRGCTSYEVKLGPSDSWSFDSSLDEVEDVLYSLYKPARRENTNKMATLLKWISTAFQMGDESYLKLTKDRRLYPKMVDYSPRN